MQEREDVTIPALRRQLAETEKGIENMLNAIQQGIFTASTKQRLEELEKQKEELSLSMTTAELQKPKLTREYMEHWFSQFRYGDPNDREFQKRLIDTFVNAIFVYDDKLVLTYNYQHGTQTITLKEVEDFLGSDLVGLSPPKKHRNFDTMRIRIAALVFCLVDLLIGQQLIEAVVAAREGEGYHIVPVVPYPLFHVLPLVLPHMHRDGAIVVDIVLHEHLLVVFPLLNGGRIAFDAAGGRLHREFQYLGGGILGILAHLGQYRITRLLADAA